MSNNIIDQSYQITRQKIILIGDIAVGKTCIINSILGHKFKGEYEASIGVDFFSKTMRYKSKSFKLQIWDSAGAEKFKSLIPNYIRGASLIFLVYDITRKSTFDSLTNWLKFIYEIENTNIVIIGNKLDLKNQRAVSEEEGKKFCEENKLLSFFEVSAKEDINVKEMLFNSIASLSIFKDIAPNDKKEDIFNELKNENNESIVGDLNGMSILSGNDQNKVLNVINQSGNNEETNVPDDNKDKFKTKKKKRFCC
jgi:small GTP-binding protein